VARSRPMIVENEATAKKENVNKSNTNITNNNKRTEKMEIKEKKQVVQK